MKTYLKGHLPKISILLMAILFVSSILTLIFFSFGEIVLLYPSNLSEPFNWYRLLTYPLFAGSLLLWFQNALVIILTGFIIENKVQKKDLLGLILLSSIIGGLIYIALNQGDPYNRPIASPTMISWGYLAATIILGVRYWRTLILFEKVVLILCFLSILSIGDDNFGFFLGQLAVIITIAALTLIRYGKPKNLKSIQKT